MTIDETWEVLQSESSEELIVEAANLMADSKNLSLSIPKSLGMGVLLINEKDILNLKLLFAVVYQIGKLHGMDEALEELTKP